MNKKGDNNMQQPLKSILENDFEIFEMHIPFPESMPHHHFHNAYEIYYALSGERYYFIKDKTYQIKKGDLVLINDYTTHRAITTNNSPFSFILCNFKKNFLYDLAKIADGDLYKCFTKNVHVIHCDDNTAPIIENLLYTMLREYQEKNTRYNDYIKTSLVQFLLYIMRLNIPKTEHTPNYQNSTHRIIDESIGYINNNFSEEITLESISKMFYITPQYFSKTFKKLTDMTFIEYLNSVRIKEAQKLLATTDKSINIIGETVGYNNNTHFCRMFKKIAGISPRAYRQLDDI